MIELVFEFILVGLVGGLPGLFYRNCLKPSGVQHLVVAISCRWLINRHPDLDTMV